MKMKLKKGDTVVIMSGDKKEIGKKGKILEVSPKEGKIIVEGRNMIKKHAKPRKQGDAGGIIDAPSAIYACKVMLICPKCGKPTRVGKNTRQDPDRGGKLIHERKCRRKACGETF